MTQMTDVKFVCEHIMGLFGVKVVAQSMHIYAFIDTRLKSDFNTPVSTVYHMTLPNPTVSTHNTVVFQFGYIF